MNSDNELTFKEFIVYVALGYSQPHRSHMDCFHNTPTHINTHASAYTQTQTDTRTHTHTKHTRTQKYAHTHAHTRTHTDRYRERHKQQIYTSTRILSHSHIHNLNRLLIDSLPTFNGRENIREAFQAAFSVLNIAEYAPHAQ